MQDNMQRLQNFFNSDPLVNGQFKFFQSSFTQDLTDFKIPHGLNFIPKDVIQTSKVGTGTIVFNYALFDRTNISVTTSGTLATDALVVRYLVGRLS